MKKNWIIFFLIYYFFIVLLVPIGCLFYNINSMSIEIFIKKAVEPISISAYNATLLMAFIACFINTIFGFVIAWIITRYNFTGKSIIDASIDLPFALPTSVAGLTLVTIYNDQNFLGFFFNRLKIQVVFSPVGVIIAMIFVSFPFVVRTVQPILFEIEKELEEMAWSLGASSWKTFKHILLPTLLPSILTGCGLSFSRSIGEYGAVVIISSNFPFKDLIAPVLIFQSLEQYDYIGATVIGTVTLTLSIILLLSINFFQTYTKKNIY